MTDVKIICGRTRLLLAGLVLAAFAVRVAYCWKFPQWGPGKSIPNIDQYEAIAESLYHRGVIADETGRLSAGREPGYSAVLAGLYLVTGPSYRWAQALNCLFGALTVALIFSLGLQIFGARTAFVAAAIATFYPQFIYYSTMLQREAFQVFVVILTAWLLVRAVRAPSVKIWVEGGAAAAVCSLTNSALLPMGFALAPAIWFASRGERRKRALGVVVYLATFLASSSIWPLRNARVFHCFILGTSGGGDHLYNGILVPNDIAGTPAASKLLEGDPVDREASRLPEEKRDRFLYRAALRFIREHPMRYAGVAWGDFVKLWRLFPYARSYPHNFRLIKWVALLSDGWIIPLGFLGLFWAGLRFSEIFIFHAIIISTTIVYTVFWAIIRYRLPMMPFVILFCAYALVEMGALARGYLTRR